MSVRVRVCVRAVVTTIYTVSHLEVEEEVISNSVLPYTTIQRVGVLGLEY